MVPTEPTLIYTLLSLVVKTQLGPELKKRLQMMVIKIVMEEDQFEILFFYLKQIKLKGINSERAEQYCLLLQNLKNNETAQL